MTTTGFPVRKSILWFLEMLCCNSNFLLSYFLQMEHFEKIGIEGKPTEAKNEVNNVK